MRNDGLEPIEAQSFTMQVQSYRDHEKVLDRIVTQNDSREVSVKSKNANQDYT